LVLHGFKRARGVDISPESVQAAHDAGIPQVSHADYMEALQGAALDVVIGTDFFEHLTKLEALEAVDRIRAALRPGGRLILRVPNAVSPFGGNYRYGDLTHESSFTWRSLRQLGIAAGFARVDVYPCTPPVHGAKSAARAALWRVFSGIMKAALIAETGRVRGHLVTQNIVAVMRPT
jgi:SAM-dependent methyltransferase